MQCLKCCGLVVKDGWFNNRYVCKGCGKEYYFKLTWIGLVVSLFEIHIADFIAKSIILSVYPESSSIIYHLLSLIILIATFMLFRYNVDLALKLRLIKIDEADNQFAFGIKTIENK